MNAQLKELLTLRQQLKGAKFGAIDRQKAMIDQLITRSRELLQGRGNLDRDNLEYLVEKASTLRDERMRNCIIELVGWGDDQRGELETMFAILIEVAKLSTPSKFEEAAQKVELRYHITQATKEQS